MEVIFCFEYLNMSKIHLACVYLSQLKSNVVFIIRFATS